MAFGKLKTHGEHLGDKMDSSDFQEETPVPFAAIHHIQLFDSLYQYPKSSNHKFSINYLKYQI
jgi:hypothetical protein